MRIACLQVPCFPLQALRRAEPELAEAPLVVTAGPGPRDPVVAVAPEAAELGVRPGVTAAQARQVAPGALLRVPPVEVVEAADEALADVAGSVSPRVRRSHPGEVLIDVGGLERRIGSEARIARELLRACHRVGLDARVGIASGVGVARIASRTPDSGFTVVAAGEERVFLAPLPISLLAPPPELAVRLAGWGLRQVGDLAALPRREVSLRMGGQGLALHRLACGGPGEAFIPDPARETLKEGVSFDEPLVALEAFLFVLNGLLSRLERRLELRGEGFADVLLELALENGERCEYRVKLVAPAREVAAVIALTRLQLEACPPGAPVEGVTVLVTPGTVRLTQGSLFGPRLPAPGRLAMTLARLAALVGPDRLGSPAVPDSHHPDAFSILPFTLPPPPIRLKIADSGFKIGHQVESSGNGRSGLAAPQSSTLSLQSFVDPGACLPAPCSPRPAFRALRPAQEAYVVTAEGRPVVARVNGLGGTVVGLAGPYRIVGEWWGDDPFARDEYDVATADGALFRVFFDRRERTWYVDGIYD